MSAHQADFPIVTMCDVLGVSTSGYYAWRGRGPSDRDRRDAELSNMIRDIHTASYGTYGSPRILRMLKRRDERVGTKRVARLMREMGFEGVSPRSVPTTTTSGDSEAAALDLVDRDFEADAPDELWVAGITYVPTSVGFMYLPVVLDVYSRLIVGWSMASHLRTELVLDALNMALEQRRPETVVQHSDQGTQYTSIAFGNRAARPRASSRRRAASATATTTPCVRVSSRRWNASSSAAWTSRRRPRRSGRSFATSRAGTIRIASIQHSTIFLASTTKKVAK